MRVLHVILQYRPYRGKAKKKYDGRLDRRAPCRRTSAAADAPFLLREHHFDNGHDDAGEWFTLLAGLRARRSTRRNSKHLESRCLILDTSSTVQIARTFIFRELGVRRCVPQNVDALRSGDFWVYRDYGEESERGPSNLLEIRNGETRAYLFTKSWRL
ncbi:hypothetical protein EI94DRAFT_608958 [Lactarius quietus]|nr:hypothetical protein EI94DRAFT_608958 [Lactarius quietus]